MTAARSSSSEATSVMRRATASAASGATYTTAMGTRRYRARRAPSPRCTCRRPRDLMAGSSVIDYGTSSGAVSANVLNALVVRDRCCRHPGCDRPVQSTEVTTWAWPTAARPSLRTASLCAPATTTGCTCRAGADMGTDGLLEVPPRAGVFTSRPPPHPGDGARPPPALFAASHTTGSHPLRDSGPATGAVRPHR